jgi:transcriptional regulator with XRE-family HTH domain
MTTVPSWTGAETKALRQAMRLSIRAFAAHLGLDARTINKWEARNTTITLRPHTQELMDTALKQAPDDVQTRFTQTMRSAQQKQHQNAAAPAHDPHTDPAESADSSLTPPSGNDTSNSFALIQAQQAHVANPQMRRRAKDQAVAQQLPTACPPTAADHTPLHAIEALRCGLNETISERTITTAGLDDWEQTVSDYGLATRDRAPIVLLGDLSADLAQLQEALSRCRSASALGRLTRVTAQMAGLMCLTLIKMDERVAFRRWARTARLAAREAGDPLTHSWVRAQEAYGHYYSGDLPEAVQVARHAQELSGQTPSVGAVLAAALEARAHAAMGHRQETRAALGYAETCLSHLDASAIGTSAFDYNEAQLRFHEGNAFTHLHDTKTAWSAQEAALSLCPVNDYMDRTMIKLDRANCLAYDRDVTGTVAVVLEATTPLTDPQRQGIIASRVRGIIAILPPRHRALPAVRDLHDLLSPPPEREDRSHSDRD